MMFIAIKTEDGAIKGKISFCCRVINKFPKDTRLYKLMTTKPGEDYANRKRM